MFLARRALYILSFCFSAAQHFASNHCRRRVRFSKCWAAERQKEKGIDMLSCYKHATPTGFGPTRATRFCLYAEALIPDFFDSIFLPFSCRVQYLRGQIPVLFLKILACKR